MILAWLSRAREDKAAKDTWKSDMFGTQVSALRGCFVDYMTGFLWSQDGYVGIDVDKEKRRL